MLDDQEKRRLDALTAEARRKCSRCRWGTHCDVCGADSTEVAYWVDAPGAPISGHDHLCRFCGDSLREVSAGVPGVDYLHLPGSRGRPRAEEGRRSFRPGVAAPRDVRGRSRG